MPAGQRRVLLAATFLTPALALVLPSGYSWGAGLLVLLGLMGLPGQLAAAHGLRAWPRPLRLWAATTAFMGLVWALHSYVDGQWLWSTIGLDRAVKYGLALLALMALARGLPSVEPLRWGCWAGAAGAGLLGAWQWWSLDWERASGFTNAIQFGNLALLLAVWSWIGARQASSLRARALGHGAALLGALACLASGSRGGWVVAPVLVLMVLLLDRPVSEHEGGVRLRRTLAILGLVTGVSLASLLVPQVQERVALAVKEVRDWQATGEAHNSVGQRLEHWAMAWDIALEKPVLGWGQTAYEARKRERVEQGRVSSAVLDFNHAHHEWLDMFAKRGLLGVLALALFFGVPAWLYWQALRQAAPRSVPSAVALCGLVTVVGFVGFGMTQVMFAHNNANMVYLFMNLLWLAALVTPPARPSAPPRP